MKPIELIPEDAARNAYEAQTNNKLNEIIHALNRIIATLRWTPSGIEKE